MREDTALTIIENPNAGRGRHRDVLTRVRQRLEARSIDVEYVVSRSGDHAAEIADSSAQNGRTIIACGGDGHVGRLANIAAQRAVPFGVIPTGAGNDFANALGLSASNLDAIVDVLTSNCSRRVDMGCIGDTLYCGVAGCGFSSQANEWANRQRWISGTGLYVAAVVKTLATYRPRPIQLSVDSDTLETSAWLVGIANAPALGGGMLIAPDAAIDDGWLDVVIVGPVSRFEFLRTFPRVFKGTHVDHPAITVLRGKSINIKQSDNAAPLAIFADGEPVGHLPNTFEVRVGCLELLTCASEKPPGHAGESVTLG